ncbi:hypothetical protein GCM10009745_25810 [Kribbella yunnanensis]|uniref:HAF repeat-containing protein n=2 Tax=Kribbella yunnanensis TaxID=190194 RepID=A0ABP4T135_9ACTN
MGPVGVASAAGVPVCTASVLALPAGTPVGAQSDVTKADDSGRFVVGRVWSGDDMRPVLWTDGVPRVLDDAPGVGPGVVDVNSSGVVIGSSTAKDGTTLPWVFADGTYRVLEVPDYMNGTTGVAAINNRGDIVGSGMSNFTEDLASLVWPGGGKPRVLLTPEGQLSSATDINDDGVVVGWSLIEEGGREREISLRWKAWDQPGEYVYARNKNRGVVSEIRGNFSGGSEIFVDTGTFAGLVWDDLHGKFYPLPTTPESINDSGDAVTIDEQDGSQVVVAVNGTTRWKFPQRTRIATLPDRSPVTGPEPDAVGTIGAVGNNQAVLWHGCSDAIIH